MPASIVKNGILLFLFVSYGSYKLDCHWHRSGPCFYWKIVGFGGNLPKDVALYIAGISIIVLALTSHVTQIVLNTPFFQFFGKISYTLYLVHALFIFWMENDVAEMILKQNPEVKYKTAVGISFIIFTPVLILVSWLLAILVDDPYKDFAYEIDIVSRKSKPLNIKNRQGVQE